MWSNRMLCTLYMNLYFILILLLVLSTYELKDEEPTRERLQRRNVSIHTRARRIFQGCVL